MLSPAGDNSFNRTVNELQAAGYNRTDRKYMVFVDANIHCGLSGFIDDDQPSLSNANNFGPSYGRVDTGCWSAHAFAHELTHTLGGVQLSAPNASGGCHCDIMCYADAPNYPTMRFGCANLAKEYRLDCNHDDYISTAPAAGSYLATHWNVANSDFLMASSPGVTGVKPTSGPLAGGTVVTVTGVNFTGATRSRSTVSPALLSRWSRPTSLKVNAPGHAAGVVNVLVTTAAVRVPPARPPSTRTSVPAVSGLRPSTGLLAGGTVVTLTGVNFTGASRVTFNRGRRHRSHGGVGHDGESHRTLSPHRRRGQRAGHRCRRQEHYGQHGEYTYRA